jgi:nicotinamide-nucleotide amidase
MRAEILAVGSELLTPQRSDTNALYLTERLRELGVEVGARVTVADDPGLLESAFRAALGRADIVIATGGLGPTADDLTREAAAAATGRKLVRDAGILERLEQRFASFGRVMAPNNAQQADLIEGALEIENPNGSAPGQLLEADGRLLVLLPGPPREMKPLFASGVAPRLRERTGAVPLHTLVLRIAALSESDVDARLAPVYREFEGVATTILSQPGQIELHLHARGASEAEALATLERSADALEAALPGRIYSRDGRDLPAVVGDLLVERGARLATAESCTAGLLAARLTDFAGASRFLERGFVTYSNRSKTELLGVPAEIIEAEGAVSGPVARAMAEGARRAAGVEVGVGITGVAGPDGGTPEKPVGLVFVALSGAAGDTLRRRQFPGGRERVRFQATQTALEMLRRGLLGISE